MIVALVAELTALVFTVNVPVVAPAATVTEAGTVAFALLDCRVTIAPLGPAAPPKVTVPVDVFPPTTVVGESDNPVIGAGLIVS